ncbi:MAG TPA: MFS transporter [Dehalococcoidia bacterium]|nr:MFS transporter [Dehalococcoidia bacterium]
MIGSHTFSSLRHRDFRLFWFGSLLSEVGTQMQVVAINWQVYELTGSAVSLGLVGLASFLPIPVFALLGGLFADRADRKKLLIYCQVFQAVIAAALAATTHAAIISPLLIYAMVLMTYVARTFQAPARQGIIPHLVPRSDFLNAVSLSTLVRQGAIVIGPAIAGFMIEFGRVKVVYLSNALSFVLLVAALLPVRIVPPNSESVVTFSLGSVLEGIHFVRRNPILLSTMILDFLANFFASALTMLPIFAKDILGQGAAGLGLMYAAPSVGAIITGLFMASRTRLKRPSQVIVVGVILYGLATIGFGLSSVFHLSLVFLALIGAGDMISTVLRNTIRQLITPDEIRGRMVAVNMVFIQGGPQLGELEAGLAAAAFGAPVSVVIGGLGAVISAIAVYRLVPQLRDYQTGEGVIEK